MDANFSLKRQKRKNENTEKPFTLKSEDLLWGEKEFVDQFATANEIRKKDLKEVTHKSYRECKY